MKTAHTPLRILLTMAALAGGAAPALAQNYTFTRIADTSGGFDPFEFGSPSINDAGQIAFRARDIDFVQGVYRGAGGELTTIALDDREMDFNFIGYFPIVDAMGRVAFAATYDDGEAIFRGTGGPLATMVDTIRDGLNFISFLPDMNDLGHVAFQAEAADFHNGLFFADGVSVAELDTPGLDNDFAAPTINNAGSIVFAAETIPAGLDGLFRYSGGSVAPVETEEGPLDTFFSAPSQNAGGDVVFSAISNEAQEGLYLRDGTGLHQIAGPPDGDTFLFSDPCINDAKQVVFSAHFIKDFTSVILLDGRTIIKGGDALDGSTVTDLTTGRFALNNNGQIAFIAHLADGRAGIYRADPVAACPADLNGDGIVDFTDYLEFLNLFDAQDPRADFNMDGIVDFSDYLEFLNHFDAGC